MSQLSTIPTIEDDICTLEEYVRAADQAAIKSTGTGLTVLFFVAGLSAIVAFAFRGILLGMMIMLVTMCGTILIQRSKPIAAPLLFPEDALARLTASEDERAVMALFRLHSFMLAEMQEPIARALIAYLHNASSPEVKIEGIPLREKLLSFLGDVQSGVYSGARTQAALLIAVIETIARFEIISAMPELVKLANGTHAITGGQLVQQAAKEALAVLSAHTDFGSKVEIPAKIKEFYEYYYGDVSSVTQKPHWLMYSLTQLLPTLSKDDAQLLGKKHREQLYGLCVATEYKRNFSELKQAIVLALGNMEDTEAIPTIAGLARMEAPTDHEQDTRSLARKQLAILTKIKEKQQVGSMLLRASDAPATAQNQLLRPASATDETQPETLLRPHLGE